LGVVRQFSGNTLYFFGDSTTSPLLFNYEADIDNTATTYTKMFELTFRTVYGAPSSFWVKFTTAKVGGVAAINARIYFNDVAVGAERADGTFEEKIDVAVASEGDRLQIYTKTAVGGTTCRLSDILIYASATIMEVTTP